MNSPQKQILSADKYFDEDYWSSLCDAEKNRYTNILDNFNALVTFGFNPQKPDFVKRYEERKAKQERRDMIRLEKQNQQQLALLESMRIENALSLESNIYQGKKEEVNTNKKKSRKKKDNETELITNNKKIERRQHLDKNTDFDNKENDENIVTNANRVKKVRFKNETIVSSEVTEPEKEVKKLNIYERKFYFEKNADRNNASVLKVKNKCQEMNSLFPTVADSLLPLLNNSIFNINAKEDNYFDNDCSSMSTDNAENLVVLWIIKKQLFIQLRKGVKKPDSVKIQEKLKITEESPKADYIKSPVPPELPDDNSKVPQSSKIDEEEIISNDSSTLTRYPRRNIARVDYTEPEDINKDDFIYCDDCERQWIGECLVHGPLLDIKDNEVISDGHDPMFAEKTTPEMLSIAHSSIYNGGSGVWTREMIPKRVRFGPYKGKVLFEVPDDCRYCWQIKKNDTDVFLIDGHDGSSSNWMRFINCARFKDELNVFAYQYKGQIYYRTFKDIPAYEEILVWYGKEYGEMLGITQELFEKPDMTKIRNVLFHCSRCDVMFKSPLERDKHRKDCNSKKVQRKRVVACAAGDGPLSDPFISDDSNNLNKDKVINLDLSEINDKPKCNGEDKRLSNRESQNVVNLQNKLYECDKCSFTSKYSSSLHSHKQIHTGQKPYLCKICSSCFTKLANLKIHERTHTGEKPYLCKICCSRFTLLGNLKLHERTHTGEKPYLCKICCSRFTLLGNLKLHERTHTGEKPYLCKICSSRFSVLSSLKIHERTHTGEKPYLCKICSSRFSVLSSLKIHERTHTGEKPYLCKICSSRFSVLSNLKLHERTHTGEKPYLCKICSCRFTKLANLKIHERTHTGEKPYLCKICSSRFTQLPHLKSHERTHTGEKPYLCKICSSRFSQLSILKIHERTHTGEKPYLCKICSSRFSQLSSLKLHERTHTGEKPYLCKICSSRFSVLSSLKRHQRTHTGEKPYLCKICSSRFSQLSILKRHQRTHTM